MHKLFADWYQKVDLSASQETLKARWQCVEAALEKIDCDSILQMTRVCFDLPSPVGASEADGNGVVRVYKESDVSFPLRQNTELLRVLFGATLVQCIENRDEWSTVTALAVASATCFGLTKTPAVDDLIPAAQLYLSACGEERRKLALDDNLKPHKFTTFTTPPVGLSELADVTQNQWPQIQQNFQSLSAWAKQASAAIDALNASQIKTRTEISTAVNANLEQVTIDNRIAVLREECNVLWWVIGEYCESAQKFWRDMPPIELCLVVGRELATIMTFSEPIPQAHAFLSKALSIKASRLKDTNAQQVIESGPSDWREKTVGDVRATVKRTIGVTPIHFGLTSRIDATMDWIDRLERATHINIDAKLNFLQWAQQSYIETLLISAIDEKNE